MNLSPGRPSYNRRSSLVFIILLSCFFHNHRVSAGCYKSIISFGDSLADTGNRIFIDQGLSYQRFPYGENFVYGPTGRCSNGRLIIDFIAQALRLSFVTPYLGHSEQDFSQGVNFAVAGATALDATFFEERGVDVHTNFSLGVQLGWFQQLVPSLCNSKSKCKNHFRNALFLVGEIGGNDYNHPLFAKKSIQELRTYVPEVVAYISSTISALIAEGAVTLVVPGNFPIGCHASYLTIYQTQDSNEYDAFGCLNWLNEFAQFHNHLLQDELNRLREIYPHAKIMYADYYNAAIDLFRIPDELGFSGGGLKACCGSGGPYNFNLSVPCGTPQSNVCDDVSSYVSWDGIHLTEAAYEWIAIGLLQRSLIVPPIDISCISSL